MFTLKVDREEQKNYCPYSGHLDSEAAGNQHLLYLNSSAGKEIKWCFPVEAGYGHHRRKFKPVAGSETDVAVFPNHYQNIIPTEPDRVWVADITYIRIASGFIYPAVVLDACSRKVIGYALSKRIDTPLALAALTAAYRIRKPAPGTCIHLTHRGCQYASALYRDSLEEFGLIGSMSAPANPYHNAQAESFMKTLRSKRFIWPDMRNSTTWQRDCHTSSKRFTTNGVCTRRWAIKHLTSSKHNLLGERLSFSTNFGPARGVNSKSGSDLNAIQHL